MTDHHTIPHFHNDGGHKIIDVGAREFMCIGAKPPFDHPHIFLDMGEGDEIICPYCSTLYRYDASLAPTQSRPEDCLYGAPETVSHVTPQAA